MALPQRIRFQLKPYNQRILDESMSTRFSEGAAASDSRWFMVGFVRQIQATFSTPVSRQRSRPKAVPTKCDTRLLALFLSCEQYDTVAGDLKERYAKVSLQISRRRATIWLWKQILTSLPPFAWAWLKRVSGVERIQKALAGRSPFGF